MSRDYNISICEENRNIVRSNGYVCNGNFVKLPCSLKHHQTIKVITPQMVEDIINDEDEFFENSFWGSRKCGITVINCNSFECESDLIMNFANAIHPGGGYKSGANAQEESLCRQSILYASIGSPAAREMYDYNRKINAPFDSDYMLLSKYVDVFRNAELSLLNKPHTTSVMTIPAPNLNGRASGQPQDEIDRVMKDRIYKYLCCAARYGYRRITLGAWGCGAFGHDARRVAGYFRELLIDRKMWDFFDEILFAVYDKTQEQYNYRAFKEAFEDVEPEICEDTYEDEPQYIQAVRPFPVCNHTQEIDQSNIGFCQGICGDGIPFEAELWMNDNEKAVTFMLPKLDIPDELLEIKNEQPEVINYESAHSYTDESVLWCGMVEHENELSTPNVMYYVKYLMKNGLIEFVGEMQNGSVIYCTDVAGNDLAHVTVALEEYGKVFAKTPLNFTPFFNNYIKTAIKRIK